MSIFDELRELKSREDYEGAWQAGLAALESEPGNSYLQTALFWVIYAAFKAVLLPLKSRELKSPLPGEQQLLDLWAARLPLLQLELPNENIDFRLWNLFREAGKFCEPLCIFVLQSGSKVFNVADHQPYQSEKGESPSVVAKVARMTAACYLIRGRQSQLPPARVVAFLRYALDRSEDSQQSKLWLEYDRAKVLLAAGQIDKARHTYLTLVRRKRSESWVWFGLATTYENEPDKCLRIVAHGLTLAHEAKFSVSGLFMLANLLATEGDVETASKALVRLHEIYQSNGWQLRDKAVELMSSSWFDGSLDPSDLDARIRDLAVGAGDLVILEPVTYTGIVQSIHASGKGADIYISKDLSVSARRSAFKDRRLFKPGSYVTMLCDRGEGKDDVVSITEANTFESEDICSFKGQLRVTNRGFGFVNEIFVLASMAASLPPECEAFGTAVRSFDKSKQNYGWKAITICVQEKETA